MAKGGYRPGAGRPKGSKNKNQTKPVENTGNQPDHPAEDLAPLAYMLKVMNNPKEDPSRRDRMAIAAAPFVHSRPSEGKGKKQDKIERAKAAASGKFATMNSPFRVVK
jgi:hypothetical protein